MTGSCGFSDAVSLQEKGVEDSCWANTRADLALLYMLQRCCVIKEGRARSSNPVNADFYFVLPAIIWIICKCIRYLDDKLELSSQLKCTFIVRPN